MARSPHGHDVIGVRLSLIIGRLLEGEIISVADLATEFNVSTKTIYRDINHRLIHMDIESLRGGRYQLSTTALSSKRTDNDIIRFAKMTNIHELFPSFDRKLVATLLSRHQSFPFVIHNQTLKEKLSTFSGFNVITEAIIESCCLAFSAEHKTINNFEPYRFIYVEQEWYLVGKCNNTLTVYPHSTIINPKLLKRAFVREKKLLELTQNKQFICALPHYQYWVKLHHEMYYEK